MKTGQGTVAKGYGGWWWLRSPNYNNENNARNINNDGNASNIDPVYITNGVVVPDLCVELW